jgi:hypothetical protein
MGNLFSFKSQFLRRGCGVRTAEVGAGRETLVFAVFEVLGRFVRLGSGMSVTFRAWIAGLRWVRGACVSAQKPGK